MACQLVILNQSTPQRWTYFAVAMFRRSKSVTRSHQTASSFELIACQKWRKIECTRLSCSWRNHPSRYQQLSVVVQLLEALVRVENILQHCVMHWKSLKRWHGFQNFKRAQTSCRCGISQDHESWSQYQWKTSVLSKFSLSKSLLGSISNFSVKLTNFIPNLASFL